MSSKCTVVYHATTGRVIALVPQPPGSVNPRGRARTPVNAPSRHRVPSGTPGRTPSRESRRSTTPVPNHGSLQSQFATSAYARTFFDEKQTGVKVGKVTTAALNALRTLQPTPSGKDVSRPNLRAPSNTRPPPRTPVHGQAIPTPRTPPIRQPNEHTAPIAGGAQPLHDANVVCPREQPTTLFATHIRRIVTLILTMFHLIESLLTIDMAITVSSKLIAFLLPRLFNDAMDYLMFYATSGLSRLLIPLIKTILDPLVPRVVSVVAGRIATALCKIGLIFISAIAWIYKAGARITRGRVFAKKILNRAILVYAVFLLFDSYVVTPHISRYHEHPMYYPSIRGTEHAVFISRSLVVHAQYELKQAQNELKGMCSETRADQILQCVEKSTENHVLITAETDTTEIRKQYERICYANKCTDSIQRDSRVQLRIARAAIAITEYEEYVSRNETMLANAKRIQKIHVASVWPWVRRLYPDRLDSISYR